MAVIAERGDCDASRARVEKPEPASPHRGAARPRQSERRRYGRAQVSGLLGAEHVLSIAMRGVRRH